MSRHAEFIHRLSPPRRDGVAVAASLFALFLTAGCGSSSSPTAPSAAITNGAEASSTSTVTTVTTTVTPALLEMLVGSLQDEYHAAAVYQGVIDDFGGPFPFVNIIRAEQTHAASVAQLFASRGLTVPANAWSVSNVPHFASLAGACAAAATAEVDNIALYDRYLATDLPLDVRNVFVNNRAASLNGHLPAFNRCK